MVNLHDMCDINYNSVERDFPAVHIQAGAACMACKEARDVSVLSHDGTGWEGSVKGAWGAVSHGGDAPPGGDMYPA